MLVYDVNSRQQQPGPIFTASDCCSACKSQPGCNVWTFCPRVEGCSNDCPANVQQCAPNRPNLHIYIKRSLCFLGILNRLAEGLVGSTC